MRSSAKRWAYSDMPSDPSHSVIVDTAFPPGAGEQCLLAGWMMKATTDRLPPSIFTVKDKNQQRHSLERRQI